MDFRPGLDHFSPRPPVLGGRGLTVCIGPIRVRVEGMDDALFEAARSRYGPFLSDALPLHVVTTHQGLPGYLEPGEDGFLRLEEHPVGDSSALLSHDFAARRGGGQGVLRISPSGDPETPLRAVENYLRWVMADLALRAEGFILHAAGVVRAGRAFLFFGPSGAGKSTVAALSEGSGLLSDDLVMVLRRGACWTAASTPFAGSLPQEAKTPGCYPIAGLFRLIQAPVHTVVPLGPLPQSVATVLACCPFVTDPAARRDRLIPLVEACCRAVPPKGLRFSKDAGFWRLLG